MVVLVLGYALTTRETYSANMFFLGKFRDLLPAALIQNNKLIACAKF